MVLDDSLTVPIGLASHGDPDGPWRPGEVATTNDSENRLRHDPAASPLP